MNYEAWSALLDLLTYGYNVEALAMDISLFDIPALARTIT